MSGDSLVTRVKNIANKEPLCTLLKGVGNKLKLFFLKLV